MATIEQNIERIANALEALAHVATHTVPGGEPQTSEQTAAIVAPVDQKADKKPRGRPAKITAEEKATAAPAEVVAKEPVKVEDDDFLTPAAKPAETKPATEADVRAAFQAYADAYPKDPANELAGVQAARALMKVSVRVEKLKEIKPDQYDKAVTDAKAALAGLKK